MRGLKLSALVLTLALAACADSAEQEDTAATAGEPSAAPAETSPAPAAGAAPAGATAEDVTAGQQIFVATGNCYTCHGPEAKGTQLAPNLTDAEWINVSGTFDEIQNVVRNGVPTPKQHPAAMPAMGGAMLSDDQIRQVAAYVWSLGGGK